MISVVIRTKNEARGLGRVLDGIAAQRWDGGVEVIVVDSGSTDGTLDIARARGSRVIQIEPASFSFGRALNVGIEAASGELVQILNGHTPPTTTELFARMAAHFDEERVAGVGGREAPTDWCNPCEAHDRDEHYSLAPDPHRIVFSNGNSMIRRSVWRLFRFDEDLPGTEDLDWATRVMAGGYEVRYEPGAEVAHCHTASLRYVYRRFYREEAWRLKAGAVAPMGRRAALRFVWERSRSDLRYMRGTKISRLWLPYIPLYRGAQAAGMMLAARREI